ncbi:hypothetical protein [Chitinophaga sp. 212800010-3]|uniref:hypothetical protein n=1 Tax=unclassified Chitinophaga TaxID=2619133 RepID=UPI002DEDC734|nr:hypothetical protein [Chitinophaga sp. 212800010-3]
MDTGISSNAYLIANVVGLLVFAASIFYPRIARLAIFLLFTTAGIVNLVTVLRHPGSFGDNSYSRFYVYGVQFIYGAFRDSISLLLLFVAFYQLVTGLLIAGRGWVLSAGLVAAAIFLALIPFGDSKGLIIPAMGMQIASCIILLFKVKKLSDAPMLHLFHHQFNKIL